jgi:hypothetical protein
MARTDNCWEDILGTYIQMINPSGWDLLINGSNHYINFNTLNGSMGYGFRDNGGTIQWKNSGGSWANIGAGGGSGNVIGPATNTDSYVPQWNGTNSLTLKNGLLASYVNTGSSLVLRDSAGNGAFNNVVVTTTPVVSSGQTIALTYGSGRVQKITGTNTVTFNLPAATYLTAGEQYEFDNDSTGVVTIYKNDGTTLVNTVVLGGYMIVVNTDNTTTNGVWSTYYYLPDNVTFGDMGLLMPNSIIEVGDGSVTAPSYSFATDPATGLYHTGTGATGAILAAINGVQKIALTATDFTLSAILNGGTAAGSYLSYKSTTGTGTAAGIAHQWLGGTNGGTVIATMLNNGNIGIGMATPNATLVVNGSTVIGIGALSTSATDGFLYIPTCAGQPTGVPTTQTGTVPIVFDTVNNRLWIYAGSQWN